MYKFLTAVLLAAAASLATAAVPAIDHSRQATAKAPATPVAQPTDDTVRGGAAVQLAWTGLKKR